jgi:AP-1 complex subunit gamma-1
MSIEAESGLRVLGINILGRFLLSRDNNIRYVALATLQKVVTVDVKAVQRHRATIIDCLKDSDISIRKRALDVAYALVNEENIKNMTKELLNYLLVADTDFKEDLCSRICMAVSKYSPSRRWQIDTLIKVMCLGGNFLKDQEREKFCQIVAGTPDLHSYTVIKLYFNMKETLSQEALVHVGVWCLGEFGDHLVSGRAVGPDNQPIHVSPADVIDLLQDVIRKPPNPDRASTTHSLVAAALIKLVTRCPSEFDRIRKTLRRFECSLNADLQQRSCEFLELLEAEWDSSRSGILDRMPVSEKQFGDDSVPTGDASIDEVPSAGAPRPANTASVGAPAPAGGADLLDLNDLLGDAPAAPTQPAPAAPTGGGDILDLLDMGGGGGGAAPAPAYPAATGGGADLGLLDIFGGGAPAPTPATAPMQATVIDIFEKAGLKIQLQCRREAAPGTSTMTARFGNMTGMPMSNFTFEAAVPKYLQLKMESATSPVLMPQTSDVTQSMTVVNTTNGEKPCLMKLRISYVHNGQPVQEAAQVANFPPGM